MNSIFDNFVNQNKCSKTLRLELVPMGKTRKHLDDSGMLTRDFQREREYGYVKKFLDGCHKKFIEDALSHFSVKVDWQGLLDSQIAKDKELFKKRKEARSIIVKVLKEHEGFDALMKPCTCIKQHLEQFPDDEVSSHLKFFDGFVCYFSQYEKNRKGLYNSSGKANAIATRLIDDNFKKFADCVTRFKHIEANYPQIVFEVEKQLSKRLEPMFKADFYYSLLTQKGIDEFNNVISGHVLEDGTKLQGLNELINLERQRNPEAKADKKLAFLPQLYKQILSDRESMSFVLEPFIGDSDAMLAIKGFGEAIESVIKKSVKFLEAIDWSSNDVYVPKNSLPAISKEMGKEWYYLRNALEAKAEKLFENEKGKDKKIKAWYDRKEIPLSDFAGLLDGEGNPIDVSLVWGKTKADEKLNAIKSAKETAMPVLEAKHEKGLSEKEKTAIKDYLDSLINFFRWSEHFKCSSETEKDLSFYEQYDSLTEELRGIVTIYNKTRSYLTKKLSEGNKTLLTFDVPQFGDGWDINVVKDKKTMLFRKESGRKNTPWDFYLGVLVKGIERENVKRLTDPNGGAKESGDCYEKMVYKTVGGNVNNYINWKKVKPFNPPERVAKFILGSKSNCPKDELQFSLTWLKEHFLSSNNKNLYDPDGNCYFDFSNIEPTKYETWDEFGDDFNDAGYMMRYEKISKDFIDDLVEKGQLLLFKLYCKDFSEFSNGKNNMHTILLLEALQGSVLPDGRRSQFRLLGKIKTFYRPQKLKDPFVHEPGTFVVNRVTKDGEPIPEKIHGELFNHYNGKKDELSKEAKEYEGKAVVKKIEKPIIKDRRFSQEKFFLYVPICMNANGKKQKDMNEEVLKTLEGRDDFNVIGIDRGERNLVYYSVVNQRGDVIEQGSMNVIESVDSRGKSRFVNYQKLLSFDEKNNKENRRSWGVCGKIKDHKEGYLSQVVYRVVNLMIKHNAVIALEDLNDSFKNSRVKFEKQVYQKFEKQLLDKLNYLCFKDVDKDAFGGIRNAYQLANKFESFKNLKNQSGFVFYVDPRYTSTTDPTTGFRKVFDMRHYRGSMAKNLEFFKRFDSIVYNEGDDAFAFGFSYDKFHAGKIALKEMKKHDWVVYSMKERYIRTEKDGHWSYCKINPTEDIKKALKDKGIEVADGLDLKAIIGKCGKGDEKFVREIFEAFHVSTIIRVEADGIDYIESCVKNDKGEFFDSRKADASMPKDSDANGAYHVALKCLKKLGVMKI